MYLIVKVMYRKRYICKRLVPAGLGRRAVGPLAWYMPYNSRTDRSLRQLAGLAPTTLAAMHGSTFVGDGTKAIGDLAVVLREILGVE